MKIRKLKSAIFKTIALQLVLFQLVNPAFVAGANAQGLKQSKATLAAAPSQFLDHQRVFEVEALPARLSFVHRIILGVYPDLWQMLHQLNLLLPYIAAHPSAPALAMAALLPPGDKSPDADESFGIGRFLTMFLQDFRDDPWTCVLNLGTFILGRGIRMPDGLPEPYVPHSPLFQDAFAPLAHRIRDDGGEIDLPSTDSSEDYILFAHGLAFRLAEWHEDSEQGALFARIRAGLRHGLLNATINGKPGSLIHVRWQNYQEKIVLQIESETRAESKYAEPPILAYGVHLSGRDDRLQLSRMMFDRAEIENVAGSNIKRLTLVLDQPSYPPKKPGRWLVTRAVSGRDPILLWRIRVAANPELGRTLRRSAAGYVLFLIPVLWVLIGTFLTTLLAWPEAVLQLVPPRLWAPVLLWTGEGILAVSISIALIRSWRALRTWRSSRTDKGLRQIVFFSITGIWTLFFMFVLPNQYYDRSNPEVRDFIAYELDHAGHPDMQAPAGARNLLRNIIVFGNVEMFDAKELNAGFYVDPSIPSFGAPKQLFEGDTRWIPYALYHEQFHLTTKQRSEYRKEQTAREEVLARLKSAANPFDLQRAIDKKKGKSLTLDDFYEQGLWSPETIKKDPVLQENFRRMLQNSLKMEIEAMEGERTLIDLEKRPNQTRKDYSAEKLEPSARRLGMTVPRWLDQFDSGNIMPSLYEGFYVAQYDMASARTAPEFEKAVIGIYLGYAPNYESSIVMFAQAAYDRNFDIEILRRKTRTARAYQERFYTWMLSHVIDAEEGHAEMVPAPRSLRFANKPLTAA